MSELPTDVKHIMKRMIYNATGIEEDYDVFNYKSLDYDDLLEVFEQAEMTIQELWLEKEQVKAENDILKQLLNNAEEKAILYQRLRGVSQ